jgi:predicted nucleotidyltransferase
MRPEPPAIFPAFRSELTVRLLTLFFLSGRSYAVSDLVELTGLQRRTVDREVRRLAQASVLTATTVHGTTVYEANEDAPFHQALTDLLTIVAGPAQVLSAELCDLRGIVFVALFGSWARRFHGEPGPAPRDIDVLIVGSPDRDEVFDAAQRARRRLGREVNPVIVSRKQWSDGDDLLLRDIRNKPLVTVCGAAAGGAA